MTITTGAVELLALPDHLVDWVLGQGLLKPISAFPCLICLLFRLKFLPVLFGLLVGGLLEDLRLANGLGLLLRGHRAHLDIACVLCLGTRSFTVPARGRRQSRAFPRSQLTSSHAAAANWPGARGCYFVVLIIALFSVVTCRSKFAAAPSTVCRARSPSGACEAGAVRLQQLLRLPRPGLRAGPAPGAHDGVVPVCERWAASNQEKERDDPKQGSSHREYW
eukprot:CAMPEP_0168426292 /NCGR_PEP_ID=MMETSP0228-20121227/35759_1 /TAXON_ID=133427 /ORGANISM="Protoceratium reticulatum, Strain CCCM 535 (=CCMP 1889)" /LENGTH=220 /DNA_ID=CAMNT_0008440301 /DNA_START=98 /DNA_END=757 /DNA_ORIENTATION=+